MKTKSQKDYATGTAIVLIWLHWLTVQIHYKVGSRPFQPLVEWQMGSPQHREYR